jgi:hypothetical protein
VTSSERRWRSEYGGLRLYEAVGGGAGAKAFEEKLKANPAVYGEVI